MLETLLQPLDVDERCGLILKDDTILEVKNIAPEPHLAYEMDPEAVLPHVIAGDIKATWHTHPDTDPNLSQDDLLGFLAWPDLRHYVIGRREGKVVVTEFYVEDGFVMSCD